MEIVICGGGKVGEALCRDLSKEDHNIILIEKSERRLQQLINNIDITGISGNAALFDVQMEAEVKNCDIFIAVTPDDETNIIAAITARKIGARYIVARVRTPEYSKQLDFLREAMGINMMINPELEAAKEIGRMMQFPNALSVEPFHHGRVSLVKVMLKNDSPIINKSLREIGRNYGDVLICIVEREEAVSIPDGNFILRAGDQLYLSGDPEEVQIFCNGGKTKAARLSTALVVGGGRLTRYLLPILERLHVRSRVIETKDNVCELLATEFPHVEVICGDGTNQAFLKEERVQNFDVVVSLTGIDEENILLSIYAAKQGVLKTITKVNRTDLLKVLEDVGLQAVVTPHRVIADHIIRLVRSIDNSQGSNVEAFYKLADGRAEALQFKVHEGSPVCNIKLSDLKTKPGLLITCIIRNQVAIYPGGQDVIKAGDDVVLVTTQPNFQDVSDILA